MAEVVHIRGHAVPAAGVPNGAITSALKEALDIAETGEVYGLAYVLLTPNGPIWADGGAILPRTGDARLMVGCLEELKHSIIGGIDD